MDETKPDRRTSRARRVSIGAQRNPASEAAIIAAAEEILLEAGPRGFSIEAVARRAKAGKPTIYRWWPSKAALLLDVYHRQKSGVRYPDTGEIEADLLGFLTDLLAHWASGGPGAVFRQVIAEAQSDAGAAEALAAYTAERRARTGEMIARAQVRGEVAPWVVPEMVAETVTSFATVRLLTNRLDAPAGEIAAFIRQLSRGIRAGEAE